MAKHYRKTYIEILPAALLSQRQAWQETAQLLPAGACLLVSDPDHKQQAELIQILARSFQEKGRRVIIWTVGQREVE